MSQPKWGPGANQSFIKIDPAFDLNGPQLDYAAEHPHMLRYEIGTSNSWGPAGHFWALPQQLWPYQQNPVVAYEPGSDVPVPLPPTKGVWQANQIVLAPLGDQQAGGGNGNGNGNVTNSSSSRGWRCVEGGRPGRWVPL